MTTLFQKRHYLAIAKILHIFWLIPEITRHVETIALTFSDLFAADNPLYDREKFINAVKGKKGGQ